MSKWVELRKNEWGTMWEVLPAGDSSFIVPLEVRELLASTITEDSVWTVEGLLSKIEEGDMHLFISYTHDEQATVMVCELVKVNIKNHCRVVALAGKSLSQLLEFNHVVETWARMNGCVCLDADVSPAGAKFFSRFGYKPRFVRIMKEL